MKGMRRLTGYMAGINFGRWISQLLQPAFDFIARHDKPLYCGEDGSPVSEKLNRAVSKI
jgi:hypothetical protein